MTSEPEPISTAMPRLAGSSKTAWAVLIVAAVLSLVADLVTKEIAFLTVADTPVVITRAEVLEASRQDPRHIGVLVPVHEAVTVVPHLLEFTLVLNPGAVFGVGAGQRWFFIGFTAVALLFGLWMFSKWTTERDRASHIAIGMVLGGGLGNLYDRVVFACVRDFIHPLPGVKFPFGLKPFGNRGEIWPYVSNVADALLLVGIGILLVFLWRRDNAAKAGASAKG